MEDYRIGDVLVHEKDGIRTKRIVLKVGSWGCRVSCTQDEGSRHFETHHLKGKCHLASLWNFNQITNNDYKKLIDQ